MSDERHDGATPEVERRNVSDIELRTTEDGQTVLAGYATVYEFPYPVGASMEVITRGAGVKTAKDGDIRLLVNHSGVPLARSKGGVGTMTVTSDDIGLRVEAPLDPANPKAAELISALKRGDLDAMSFGFNVVGGRESWEGDTRRIDEFRAMDVSVVTYPANPATVVQVAHRGGAAESETPEGVRSLELAKRQAQADKSRRR